MRDAWGGGLMKLWDFLEGRFYYVVVAALIGWIVIYNLGKTPTAEEQPAAAAGPIQTSQELAPQIGTFTESDSGHDAGYEWAERNEIEVEDGCESHSTSFEEGCVEYVQEHQEDSGEGVEFEPVERDY